VFAVVLRGWLLRSVADDDVEVVVDRFVFDVVLNVPFPFVVVPLPLPLVTEPFATTLLPPRRAAARLVLKLLLWSSSLVRCDLMMRSKKSSLGIVEAAALVLADFLETVAVGFRTHR